ncbi:hypothetical protein HYG86_12885 [Alkalicella caledoniensis]|uniref:ATPase n=1 Tax=Alkalicella caledoniensis TaxID=2731377 RepID=A0A7G9WA91_ALKCA|nr:PRK06851 family protein [Alkalicella caledoniensis]QNO15603.1 hypothetical protein HYG86_12885 [Alkalicella caledoniensis]
MTGKIKNIYPGGNTSQGFYSFYENVLSGLDRVFILKGGPGTGKSSMSRKLGEKYLKEGYDITYLHCSSDNNSLDGIIIDNRVAIVDGTAPHVIDPKYPGIVDEIINLGECWDREKLLPYRKEIIEMRSQIAIHYKRAYSLFHQSKLVHDDLEQIYLSEMDFGAADDVTQNLIKIIVGNREENKTAKRTDMFFGAITPNGSVNFYEELTDGIRTRFFVKGRAGTGKSTMMKKIAEAAISAGFDTEIYHCAFDPNSVDMVIIPTLDVVILDGTAPHVFNPVRPTDILVDMYALCLPIDIDKRRKKEIDSLNKKYEDLFKMGIPHIQEARSLHLEIEKYYVAAMDYKKVDEKQKYIEEEIEKELS